MKKLLERSLNLFDDASDLFAWTEFFDSESDKCGDHHRHAGKSKRPWTTKDTDKKRC